MSATLRVAYTVHPVLEVTTSFLAQASTSATDRTLSLPRREATIGLMATAWFTPLSSKGERRVLECRTLLDVRRACSHARPARPCLPVLRAGKSNCLRASLPSPQALSYANHFVRTARWSLEHDHKGPIVPKIGAVPERAPRAHIPPLAPLAPLPAQQRASLCLPFTPRRHPRSASPFASPAAPCGGRAAAADRSRRPVPPAATACRGLQRRARGAGRRRCASRPPQGTWLA